jgi:8-hydroxy-5-deazaflavin:NADPH oxidoreductase
MKISVFGTGRMGKGLIKTIAPIHPNVMWASRSPEKVITLMKELEVNVEPVEYEVGLDADVIIHSLWFRDLIPWANENREKLKGKILVDIVNPFTVDFSDFTLDWGTSAAEELQKVLPETRIVGAFKNTFFKVFHEPIHQGLQSDVYITSDDQEAKKTVIDILSGIPFRILDGGALKNNRTIERMTLFEREVSIRYGNYPHVSFRIWGVENKTT